MPANNRKIVNYLKVSGLSRSYYLHIFAGGVAFLGIIMIYVSRLLSEVQNVVQTLPDPTLTALVEDRILAVAVLFFICFAGFMASTVFYMIVLGQRVGGPVVAICSYIQDLKEGRYDVQRKLRKNDELQMIMEELQDLAKSLKNKNKHMKD